MNARTYPVITHSFLIISSEIVSHFQYRTVTKLCQPRKMHQNLHFYCISQISYLLLRQAFNSIYKKIFSSPILSGNRYLLGALAHHSSLSGRPRVVSKRTHSKNLLLSIPVQFIIFFAVLYNMLNKFFFSKSQVKKNWGTLKGLFKNILVFRWVAIILISMTLIIMPTKCFK